MSGKVASENPTTCDELLAGMISFDSVNDTLSGRRGSETPLAIYIERVAAGIGLKTRRMPVEGERFNLLVSHERDASAPWLMFVCHLDTVGVDGMTVEPFVGEVRDGKMFGRGACDTKGSGAAMLWALREYARAGETSANNVALVFTIDEEITRIGVRALVCDQLATLPARPVGAIVGEPTGLEQVVAHGGVVRWKIHTDGVAAHSSDPSQGRSAIEMMTHVMRALQTEYIDKLTASHPLVGKAQCSINTIRGGVSINIIPAHCEISVDRRVVPGEDATRVAADVEQVLEKLRPRVNVRQDAPFIAAALDPASNERFIGFVTRTLRDMNLPAKPKGLPFCTEASDLSEVGIPAVVLGPGDVAAAHTADESIELKQLHRAVDVYLQLMRQPLASSR